MTRTQTVKSFASEAQLTFTDTDEESTVHIEVKLDEYFQQGMFRDEEHIKEVTKELLSDLEDTFMKRMRDHV